MTKANKRAKVRFGSTCFGHMQLVLDATINEEALTTVVSCNRIQIIQTKHTGTVVRLNTCYGRTM